MLILIILLFLIAGGLGSIFVNSSINTWYALLNKPLFTPPGFVFGPVWTVLYILLAVFYWRLDRLYKSSKEKELIKQVKGIFILQLVLNYMWTPVFFGLRSILGGLILLVLLDLLVLRMTWLSLKINNKCFYISLIYLLWLLFATSLNLGTFILN